jgi:hypothetical protein
LGALLKQLNILPNQTYDDDVHKQTLWLIAMHSIQHLLPYEQPWTMSGDMRPKLVFDSFTIVEKLMKNKVIC